MKINLTQLGYAKAYLQHFQQGIEHCHPLSKTGLWSPRVAVAVDQFSMNVNHIIKHDFHSICQKYHQKISAYVHGIKDYDRLQDQIVQAAQGAKEEL